MKVGGGEQLSILLHSCLLFTRKEGKKKFNADKQKICKLAKKEKNLNFKSDKIDKLIINKLNLNVNHHIKIGRNHNLLQV
jgi:hypothetical protein